MPPPARSSICYRNGNDNGEYFLKGSSLLFHHPPAPHQDASSFTFSQDKRAAATARTGALDMEASSLQVMPTKCLIECAIGGEVTRKKIR